MIRNQYLLETASWEELFHQFTEYAEAYTPEWNPDEQCPDAGLAVANIFLEQMGENVKKYNELLERYHWNYIEMLRLSLSPPKPAKAIVMVGLMGNGIAGLLLKEGTKFTADKGEETVIFQSTAPVYVTESKIDTIIMKDGRENWKLVAGRFNIPQIGEMGVKEYAVQTIEKFPAFQVKQSQLERKLVIWHSYAFQGAGDRIFLRCQAGERLFQYLQKGSLRLQYIASGNEKDFEQYTVSDTGISFTIPEENVTGILIKAEQDMEQDVTIGNLFIGGEGYRKTADYVYNDIKDCDVACFEPFGDSITVFAHCNIGCNSYFSKKGSVITMEFQVTYGENMVGQRIKRQEPLKVIKRRRYEYGEEIIADAYVEQVVFEYDTGRGYRTLHLLEDCTDIFADGIDGYKKISFICPEEWEETEESAYTGRSIRIRVLKSEHCYLQPCVHHYPIIKNLNISYTYDTAEVQPEQVELIEGLSRRRMNQNLKQDSGVLVFRGSENSNRTRMYIGFDKALRGGPVSIWVRMEDRVFVKNSHSLFYYYGAGEWKRLKVIDKTDDFTHSGIILFYPPKDMEPSEEWGEPRYYICIEGEDNGGMIRDIAFNGIETENIHTGEEEDYYIQYPESYMVFQIDCEKLSTADVWVNEVQELTREEMLVWSEKSPEEVRIEYDYIGRITAFYVKWEEVDSLEMTDRSRVYVLDRRNGKLCFGDGVRHKIPRNTTDTAFKLVPYYCDGGEGNVEAGSIHDTISNILYVDKIENPIPAFGGSILESRSQMMDRGTGMISSHGRFISREDYIRAVMGYSDMIHHAKCVMDKGEIDIVLLLKDYKKGSGSFHRLKNELKDYLLKRSDMTITPQHMHIMEPVFTDIHITMWVKGTGAFDGFSLSARFRERLEKYLDSITGKNGSGWKIGELPKQSQLLMEINAMRENCIVQKILITAEYVDKSGRHECSLEELSEQLYAVIRSGRHKVYIE